MDWGNDYFTFSDTNIEYIWRFLQIVHERGWLVKGHRSTEWCPRCGTSISAHELHGQLRGPPRPVALRPLPAARPRGRVDRRLDDDPVDAARQRRGRRQPRGRLRPARERRVGRVRALPGRDVHRGRQGRRARRAALHGAVRRARARVRRRAPRDPVGRRRARHRHRHRPHRAGLRRRGLRALEGARPRRAHARRRGRPLLSRVRLAARPLDRRGGRADRRRPRRPRPARPRRDRRAQLSVLLALPHAADLPPLRRLVHRGRRAPPAAARRERDRRVDARVHGQANGRLAAQHGRLEHLAAPLLRPAAAVLPLRVRSPERDRVAGRARGARARRARPARGAPASLDRRGADRVREVR